MLRTPLTVAALLCAALPAAADEFKLDAECAKIKWVGTKPGGKHEGGFKKMTGKATVTPSDLTTLKIELDIDADSITSDDQKLTGHLKAPDFFNVKEFPKVEFKATKVEKKGDEYVITGDLTMLGKTKPVEMPSKVKVDGDTLGILSDFDLDRTEWGMTYGKGKIDDKVKLTIEVKAKK